MGESAAGGAEHEHARQHAVDGHPRFALAEYRPGAGYERAELTAMMPAHHARMTRLMQMHRDMVGNMKSYGSVARGGP